MKAGAPGSPRSCQTYRLGAIDFIGLFGRVSNLPERIPKKWAVSPTPGQSSRRVTARPARRPPGRASRDTRMDQSQRRRDPGHPAEGLRDRRPRCACRPEARSLPFALAAEALFDELDN